MGPRPGLTRSRGSQSAAVSGDGGQAFHFRHQPIAAPSALGSLPPVSTPVSGSRRMI